MMEKGSEKCGKVSLL